MPTCRPACRHDEKPETGPDGDIEFLATGARRGEKLREELFYDSAALTGTSHPEILRADRSQYPEKHIEAGLNALNAAMEANDPDAVRKELLTLVKQE